MRFWKCKKCADYEGRMMNIRSAVCAIDRIILGRKTITDDALMDLINQMVRIGVNVDAHLHKERMRGK